MKSSFLIGLSVIMGLLMCGSAAAWVDGYDYRQPITLTGGASGAQTDYQLLLNVSYNAHMQADFDDIRFTNTADVEIDTWLESKVDSSYALVWAEFPTTPANGVAQTYYMYYGNLTSSDVWDGGAVFPKLFDDFEDGDVSDWSGNVMAIEGTTVKTGTYSGRATGGDGPYLTGASRTSDYTIEVDYIQPGASGRYLCVGKDSTWLSNAVVLKTANNKLYYNDGSDRLIKDPFTSDVWHKFIIDVHFSTNNFDITLDGSNIGTGLATRGAISEHNGINPLTNGQTEYLDNIFVHKYATNPATSAFGSEEVYVPPSIPTIIPFNNITGAQAHVPLAHGTVVLFNATAGPDITWSWMLDGVDQGVSIDTYTHTFDAGFGYYAVTVYATTIAGTSTFTWGIWENIETSAQTVPTFSDTSYQMLLDSIDYPPNMEDFGKAMVHPFVQMVGVIFYLFIFGIPLTMMYIRQDNMTLPTTLLLLFGSIIIFMLPPQWQIIAGALMTLGFVGILFKLYKERER